MPFLGAKQWSAETCFSLLKLSTKVCSLFSCRDHPSDGMPTDLYGNSDGSVPATFQVIFLVSGYDSMRDTIRQLIDDRLAGNLVQINRSLWNGDRGKRI